MSALSVSPFSAPGLRRSTESAAAALDLGAARVLALVGVKGAPGASRRVALRGIGAQATRRGDDLEVDDFAGGRCARIALDCAERMAGVAVRSAVGVLSTPGIISHRVRAHVAPARGVITEADVRRVVAAAAQKAQTSELVALHVAPLGYSLDEGGLCDDPRGYAASRLSIDACVVLAPREATETMLACADEAGVHLSDLAAAPYMAGLAVLSVEERRQGAIVIDLGATTTGVAAFVDDTLVHAATLPVGGDLLTEVLAERLGTSFAAAERLKTTQPIFGAPNAEQVSAARVGEDGRLSETRVARGYLAETMAPALIDIFKSVAVSLAEARLPAEAARWSIALTGGGAEMVGLAERAGELLRAPVRIARPIGFPELEAGAASGSLAAAAGALRWVCEPPADSRIARPRRPETAARASATATPRAAARAWDWFKANF